MSDPTIFGFLAAAFMFMTFALVGVIINQPKVAGFLAIFAGLSVFGAVVKSIPDPPKQEIAHRT